MKKSQQQVDVAGINGENVEKTFTLDLSFLKNKKGQQIGSGNVSSDEPSFSSTFVELPASEK